MVRVLSAKPLMLSRSSRALGTVATRLLTYALGFSASVIVARALQPAGRGSYFVLVTVASLALHFGHLSIQQANNSLWLASADRPSLVSTSLLLGTGLGGVAGLVTAVSVLGPASSAVPVVSDRLLVVAVCAVPLAATSIYLKGLLVIDDRIGTVNWSALFGAVVQSVLLVGLGVTGRLTVGSVVWVSTLTVAAPLVVLVPALARDPGLARPSESLVRRAVATGLRYHLGAIAAYLMLRVDVLMLNATEARDDVGIYSLSVTLAELALLVTDSLAQVAVPGQASSDETKAAEFTARVVRANLIIGLVSVGALALAGPILVPLIFGAEFGPAARPLVALAPGIVALAAQWPLRFFANRLGRPALVSTAAVVGLAANVGLNLALIPQLGILGAAIASSISYCGTTAFYAVWFTKTSGRSGRELTPTPAEVTAALGAVLADFKRRRQ